VQLSFPTKMKLWYDLQQVTCETKGSSIMKLSFLTKMKIGYNLPPGGEGEGIMYGQNMIYIHTHPITTIKHCTGCI
jgi:hypothetical protein